MENEEIVIDIKIELDSDNNKSNEQFCQSSGDKYIVTQDTEDIDNEVENTDRKIHLIQYFSENTDNFRSTADQIQYKPATHTYTVNAVHGDASQHFHEEMGDAVKNEEIYAWDKHTGDTSCLDQHAENNLIQTFICSHEMDDHEAIKIKQEPIGDDISSELCSEITNENDTCKQQTVNWSPVSIPWQAEYFDTKINKIKQEQNKEFDMEMCQARGNSSDTYANNEKELSGGREAHLNNPLLLGYEKTCSGAFQIKIENHEIPEEDYCPVKDERNESESKSLLSHNMPMSCEQDADTYEPFNSMGTKAKENNDTGGRIREETRACMYNITTEGNKAAEITVNATPLTLFKKVITKDSQVQLKIKKQYTHDNSALRKCFHCTWHTSSEEKYKVHLQSHIHRINMTRKSIAEVDLYMEKIKCHFKELNWNLDVVKCEIRTCVYIFLDDEWACKHYLTYHEGNAFVCSKPSCFRTFKDNWKLRSHEIGDHAFNIRDRKTKIYSVCKQVDVWRKAEAVLNDHSYLKCQLETKHEGKPFICSKPHWFRNFEDKWKQRSHEKVEHAVINEKIKAINKKKTSVGKQTDVASWTEAVLNDHCYFDVQLEANFRCDVRNCLKLFKCMAEMKSHKIREHSATVSFSGNDHLSDLNCSDNVKSDDHLSDLNCSDNVKSEHNYDCGSSQIYDNIDSDTVFKGVLYADERGNIFHGGRVIFKINKPNQRRN